MLNDNKKSLSTSLDKSKAEIRLLHLQPRRGVDEITCTLQLANLDAKNCEYEALSYEWGDLTNAGLVIWIDGETVPVRENLWWALWYLRYEERERVVWIDALCINQHDNKERQHQVGQMGRIYERATRVVAWIGRELTAPDPEEDRINSLRDASAIKFINLIFGDIEHNRYFRNWKWLYHDADKLQLWQNSHTKLYTKATDSDWASLLRLCQRRYWSRLWIIQELVLARSIVIQLGSFLLRWEALEHFFCQARLPENQNLVRFCGGAGSTLSGLRNSVPFKIYLQRNEKFGAGISPALFDLFYLHRDAQCLQVQDKLFGLLGMSAECCQLAIRPDYDIPLSTLCRAFLVHHLQQHAGHPTRNKVPHWTCGLHQALTLFSVDSLNGGRMASGSSISIHLYKPSSASFSVPCLFRGPLSRIVSVGSSDDIWVSIGSISDLDSAAANALLKRTHQAQLGKECPDIAALSSKYTYIRESINSISAPAGNQEAITITQSIRRSLENALESYTRDIAISIGEMQAGDLVFDLGDQILLFCVRYLLDSRLLGSEQHLSGASRREAYPGFPQDNL